jgi:hypothetical protein
MPQVAQVRVAQDLVMDYPRIGEIEEVEQPIKQPELN